MFSWLTTKISKAKSRQESQMLTSNCFVQIAIKWVNILTCTCTKQWNHLSLKNLICRRNDLKFHWMRESGSRVLKASTFEARSIPLIRTPSTSQSILNQHFINSWLIVAECIDQHSMVCLQELVDSWLNFDWNANQVLTEYWWRCRSSVDRDIDPVHVIWESNAFK